MQRAGTGECTVHPWKAEDAGRMKEHREQYDLAVSRAVANLASLSEYCIPFVKKGGFFIPYKSGEIEEELNQGKKAAAILGGEINEVVRAFFTGRRWSQKSDPYS